MSLRPLQICLTRVLGTRTVMLALLLFGAGLWAVAQEATPPDQVPIPGAGPEAGPAPVPDELPPPPGAELPSAAPTPIPGTVGPNVIEPTGGNTPTVEAIAERPRMDVGPETTPLPTPGILPDEPTERERAGLPIYMRELNLRIFDPGRGEELTALQEAAQMMSKREKSSEQRSLAHIKNLLTYEYTIEGTSQTQIVVEAQTRALKSAAARVYFADYLLLGRDLLEPYLRQYGAPSVARTTVLDQRLLSEGRQRMTIRVSVNLDQLYRDLNEKHFIAKPNLRPTVAVLLQELMNGEPDSASGGRQRIEQTMDRNLFRVFSRRMAKPPLNSNLNSDPELLRAARFEAQRNDVDIVVTGVLTIRSADRGPILYDEYAFQEADLVLRMYRVDTGELLKEVVDRYSASGPTPAQATSNVLDAMMARSTQKLADYLRVNWGRQMLEEDYTRVMISGVADDEIPAALNALRSFAPGVEIYQKAYYGDVLVVNVVLPKKHAAEDFAGFLRASREPQFDVDQVAKRRFILEVI